MNENMEHYEIAALNCVVMRANLCKYCLHK